MMDIQTRYGQWLIRVGITEMEVFDVIFGTVAQEMQTWFKRDNDLLGDLELLQPHFDDNHKILVEQNVIRLGLETLSAEYVCLCNDVIV